LAERYEWCFAGAAALALHRARPRLRDGVWGVDGLWLRGVLALVLEALDAAPADATQVYGELGTLLTTVLDAPATLLGGDLGDLGDLRGGGETGGQGAPVPRSGVPATDDRRSDEVEAA
ncbi:hypothetical protein, partial [Streptomyces coelicoflavus]|nr:hypothetical protein [Streptomyces coelicoflavus]